MRLFSMTLYHNDADWGKEKYRDDEGKKTHFNGYKC